ncbi:hypothetical protein MKW98_013757 [Papaver atlanticum]|uniref:TF-B3 domain-containing protein n=1 Tax=Papaver atlanticum TaxID=357466 RepID=A0AAD4S807_9MAGN|nr:hypothetical protein MKW98_013757 [Papaver atlanticum]
MKNMHGDGTEQNHQENEEKHDEDDRRRRDMYEQINPSNYEYMMSWEDEVIGTEDLLHVDDTLMSYGDFPPLPDFPCISSSSSSSKSCCSSSAPPPTSSMSQRQHHGSVTCRNNSFSSSSATSSASSSASWAVGKSDHKEHSVVDEKTKNQEYHENCYDNLLSTTDSMEIQQDEFNRLDSGDCIDVMEGFGEMGLFDTDDIWDPCCLFPYEEEEGFHQTKEDQKCSVDRENDENDNDGDQEKNNKPSEDLALVFLEWLKSNKETISAEDLRSIKLKRSTIECAAKRLGGGKEGMKQLLKLILEWVQNNHLQKKRLKEGQASSFPSNSSQQQHQNPKPNSHEFSSFTPPESNPACFVPTANPWNVSGNPPPPPVVPPSTYVSVPMTSGLAVYPPPPPPPPMHGFISGDPSVFVPHFNQSPYPSSADYMFDASSHLKNWPHHQPPPPTHHFSLSSHPYGASYHHQDPHAHHFQPPPPPPPLLRSFSNYHQNQYQSCHQMFQGSNTTTSSDGSLIRLGSSATKEARKKRMARQRKVFSHHQRHAQNNHQTNTMELQQTKVLNDTTATHHQALNNPSNWVLWSPSPPLPTTVCGSLSPVMMVSDGPPLPVDPPPQSMQSPNYPKQINMENRRQGCKPTEKNLKFLLQKVLKQSDVGNLGRIVLPKKEAETYLPELEARDGISIAMEDIGTSRVWNMRYRFWPNNKSRMYLLENTGDFVRSNGLQEGDFIVIYSDIKCGKFMIRGVKVRQPGSKSEAKRSTKANRNLHANSPMCEGTSASMIKQAVV